MRQRQNIIFFETTESRELNSQRNLTSEVTGGEWIEAQTLQSSRIIRVISRSPPSTMSCEEKQALFSSRTQGPNIPGFLFVGNVVSILFVFFIFFWILYVTGCETVRVVLHPGVAHEEATLADKCHPVIM
jgi:hypothetical protein